MLAVILQPRVATNLQFAKTAASAKHNKMTYAVHVYVYIKRCIVNVHKRCICNICIKV